MVHFFCPLQKMMPVNLSDVMRSVSILALLTAPNLDLVTGLLKCFPCVEKLYIVVRVSSLLNPVTLYSFHLCCVIGRNMATG